MVSTLKEWTGDFIHLLFPHNCVGCGSDLLGNEDELCFRCHTDLPVTGFFDQPGNPVEQIFYGRLNVKSAAAAYYFTKDSLIQQLIVQLKYRGNKEIGYYLGKLAGQYLVGSRYFKKADLLLPLPLNKKKEKKRGYNQAAVICAGMASVCGIPVLETAAYRNVFTETQTHKGRTGRWLNMEGVFTVRDPEPLRNKHILLVDDVVTTGATLESCGAAILSIPGTELSIATLAYTA
ncbi:ComF family protein [Segetibacter sp. 3557_3]|uniref:ComF family protein n=1 Tax=Segetibacter sp. 3557_3 TaxID=2547429 RepID=UPI001058FD85|nr:phosphoribosyltransferase family protein [Segetibacter sp. 3557_3]TDH24067.1 ComF family protein [Segetibacter sp. 3557_3]